MRGGRHSCYVRGFIHSGGKGVLRFADCGTRPKLSMSRPACLRVHTQKGVRHFLVIFFYVPWFILHSFISNFLVSSSYLSAFYYRSFFVSLSVIFHPSISHLCTLIVAFLMIICFLLCLLIFVFFPYLIIYFPPSVLVHFLRSFIVT